MKTLLLRALQGQERVPSVPSSPVLDPLPAIVIEDRLPVTTANYPNEPLSRARSTFKAYKFEDYQLVLARRVLCGEG